MITLRLIAMIFGGLVLVVPPLLMGPDHEGSMPGWIAAGALLALGLISASFIYVAAAGDRMRRPGNARTLGGLLLLIPAMASIAMLATRSDAELLWGSGVLLCATITLFISFVFPSGLDRRQRPMRMRERNEPTLRIITPRH